MSSVTAALMSMSQHRVSRSPARPRSGSFPATVLSLSASTSSRNVDGADVHSVRDGDTSVRLDVPAQAASSPPTSTNASIKLASPHVVQERTQRRGAHSINRRNVSHARRPSDLRSNVVYEMPFSSLPLRVTNNTLMNSDADIDLATSPPSSVPSLTANALLLASPMSPRSGRVGRHLATPASSIQSRPSTAPSGSATSSNLSSVPSSRPRTPVYSNKIAMKLPRSPSKKDRHVGIYQIVRPNTAPQYGQTDTPLLAEDAIKEVRPYSTVPISVRAPSDEQISALPIATKHVVVSYNPVLAKANREAVFAERAAFFKHARALAYADSAPVTNIASTEGRMHQHDTLAVPLSPATTGPIHISDAQAAFMRSAEVLGTLNGYDLEAAVQRNLQNVVSHDTLRSASTSFPSGKRSKEERRAAFESGQCQTIQGRRHPSD